MASKTSGQTEKAKQSTKKATDRPHAQDTASEAQDTASEATQGATNGAGGEPNGIFSELKDTARDAALEVLKPVVKDAAQSAAGYAVKKGPELVKDKVGDLTDGGGLEELAQQGRSPRAGPLGKVAGDARHGREASSTSILPGGDDDEDGEGGEAEADATGSGRRMPVQQSMDVAVPLERRLQPVDPVRGVPELHAPGRQREPGRRGPRHLHREDVELHAATSRPRSSSSGPTSGSSGAASTGSSTRAS